MNAIDTKLEERELSGKPIRVGLIGAGQMGQEIVAQIGEMVGMEVAGVVDLTEDRAGLAYTFSRKQKPVELVSNVEKAAQVNREGKWVIGTDSRLLTGNPQIDVIVDATGQPEIGAEISLDAFNHHKHVVMMNVECDVTIGATLRRMADNAGIVYSLASGDEPAAVIELIRFCRAIGHTVVVAGKGKNNPLDIHATPEEWRKKAQERHIANPRLMVEFVDGSKTMVEMSAVSNATGLLPDVPGMHGPHALVKELTTVFRPSTEKGILSKIGVVDYAIGDIHPGVFVIFTTENRRIMDGPAMKALGDGPYYLLYRPYHLCSGEVPLTVARAVIYGESSGHPLDRPVSECVAIAKKDLEVGEELDMIGEYCYRGSIETAARARYEKLLPLGLARGCIMKKAVPRDTPITYDMVEMTRDSVLLQLRKIQDNMLRR